MDTPDINLLRDNVQAARLALDRAAAGRDYTLLAASKTQSAEVINLLPQCGIFDYGENRVQEWVEKHEKIDKSLKYHQHYQNVTQRYEVSKCWKNGISNWCYTIRKQLRVFLVLTGW